MVHPNLTIAFADSRPLYRLLALLKRLGRPIAPVILNWSVTKERVRVLVQAVPGSGYVYLATDLSVSEVKGCGQFDIGADHLRPFVPATGPCALRTLSEGILAVHTPDLTVELRGLLDQAGPPPREIKLGKPIVSLEGGVLAKAVRRCQTAIAFWESREYFTLAYIGLAPGGNLVMLGTDGRQAITIPFGIPAPSPTPSLLLETRLIGPLLALTDRKSIVTFYEPADPTAKDMVVVKTETMTLLGAVSTDDVNYYPAEKINQMTHEARTYPVRATLDRKRWKRLLFGLSPTNARGEPAIELVIDETGQLGVWCSSGQGEHRDILVAQADFHSGGGADRRLVSLQFFRSLLHSGGDTVTIAVAKDQPLEHILVTDGWFEAILMPIRPNRPSRKATPPPETSVCSSPE